MAVRYLLLVRGIIGSYRSCPIRVKKGYECRMSVIIKTLLEDTQ
jgi:hypothetical protein